MLISFQVIKFLHLIFIEHLVSTLYSALCTFLKDNTILKICILIQLMHCTCFHFTKAIELYTWSFDGPYMQLHTLFPLLYTLGVISNYSLMTPM